MHPELFSDGVSEVMVSGSIVRVDLMSLSTERDTNNNPKPILCQRLIFSVEGFANSVEVMQKALQSLIDTGVVRKSAAAGPSAQPQPTSQGTPARGTSSPNFR